MENNAKIVRQPMVRIDLKKKLKLILFIVVVLLIVGGVFMLVTKKDEIFDQKQSTDWQVFMNDVQRIEFKYPPEFSRIETNDEILIAAFKDELNKKGKKISDPDITLRVIPIEPEKSYETILINDVILFSGEHPKSINEFVTKKIGENTIYYIIRERLKEKLSVNYYLVGKNKIIVFGVIFSPVDWNSPNYNFEKDPLNLRFQQIFSTFKFF